MTWEGRWAGDGVKGWEEGRKMGWGWCDKSEGEEGGGVGVV